MRTSTCQFRILLIAASIVALAAAEGAAHGSGTTAVYSYSIASGGYDAVGNVLAYTDSVTGTWSMTGGYDSLNRLVAAKATAGPYYSSSSGGLDAT